MSPVWPICWTVELPQTGPRAVHVRWPLLLLYSRRHLQF